MRQHHIIRAVKNKTIFSYTNINKHGNLSHKDINIVKKELTSMERKATPADYGSILDEWSACHDCQGSYQESAGQVRYVAQNGACLVVSFVAERCFKLYHRRTWFEGLPLFRPEVKRRMSEGKSRELEEILEQCKEEDDDGKWQCRNFGIVS